VAIDDDAEPGTVEHWARLMLEEGGVTGELIRIGPGHIGKALP
jgi:hypothetical protein